MSSNSTAQNEIQYALLIGSLEESGIWEILIYIAREEGVDREVAWDLLKSEMAYFQANGEMYLLRSEKLYDSASSQVLDKQLLAGLTLDEVEFHESGPFYYISAAQTV
jgi:hypothetical protein